jgi:hypothetical protein
MVLYTLLRRWAAPNGAMRFRRGEEVVPAKCDIHRRSHEQWQTPLAPCHPGLCPTPSEWFDRERNPGNGWVRLLEDERDLGYVHPMPGVGGGARSTK